MTVYRCRASLIQKETAYDLTDRTLLRSDGVALDLGSVKSVRLYRLRGSGALPAGSQRCVVKPVRGRAIVVTSYHFKGVGNFEDRSADFTPFVGELVRKVRAASPDAHIISGMPLALWFFWAVALAGAAIAMPLMTGLLVIEMAGGSDVATATAGLVTLAVIGICLFYFLRPLGTDWPRRAA